MHFHLGCVCHVPHPPQKKIFERNIHSHLSQNQDMLILLMYTGWLATEVGTLHSLELGWGVGLAVEMHPTIFSSGFYLVALRPETALESASSTSHLLWKKTPQDGWALGSNCQRLCTSGPFWRLLTSTSLVSDYCHPVSLLRS